MITVRSPRSLSQPRCQPRSWSRNSARAPRNSSRPRNSPRSRKWSPPTRTPTPKSSALAMVGAATAIVASAASARLSFLMFNPLVAAQEKTVEPKACSYGKAGALMNRQFIRQTKQPVHLGFDGVHTQAELRKLAAEYIVQAIDIGSKELGLLRSEE